MSGDFVIALIEESRDLNEYAFVLGALSHYAADASGHPIATNRAVAMMYPKLAKKYGPVVTYEDKPSAHAKVEFGFDVDQVAEGNLRRDILAYYSDLERRFATKKDPEAWQKVLSELDRLKAMPTAGEPKD